MNAPRAVLVGRPWAFAILFFASGVAALVYQVVWQRILAIFSGTDVFSATIIVAAFMAGLGLGNLAGGHVADRVSHRGGLVLFGLAELAVALFGFVSAWLYYHVLYARLGTLALGPVVMATVLFASLLWPTFFMGVSLPLLARALIHRIDRASSTIGLLYGVNTLGAATGAFAATWWLLPQAGLEGSLQTAAVVNTCCAAAVIPLVAARGHDGHRPSRSAQPPMPGAPAANRGMSFPVWVAVYAISGFIALSLEIVWFRALGVMMKATAFTFGTVLTNYLAGLALGALAGIRLARRVRQPAAVFLGLQAASGWCAVALLVVLVALVDDTRALRGYFGSYEPVSVPESVDRLRAWLTGLLGSGRPAGEAPVNFLRFYVALPLLLVLPATFLMGCSFPVLQRVAQTDVALVGRRLGTLLLGNIAGAIAGTIVTGWVLLDALGTPATLGLLTAMSGALGVLAVRAVPVRSGAQRGRRILFTSGTVVAFAGLFLLVPDGDTFWARLHGTDAGVVVAAEDGSGLAVVKLQQAGFEGKHVVFVNGLGQSTLPYGDLHTALGAVPAFVHAAPRRAAVIGLGSGDTAFALAGRQHIEQITALEIVRPQLEVLRRLTERSPYAGLQSLLRDPRIEHVFADGRAYLRRSGRRYDVIEADALRPGSAYAGNLYSEEYFRLLRERLSPGGLAATWAPTTRIRNTFLRIFPHVVALPGMLLGSDTPIEVDRHVVLARTRDPVVQRYFAAAGIDVQQLLDHYLAAPTTYGPELDRSSLTDLNTDLFPRDEFARSLRDLDPQ